MALYKRGDGTNAFKEGRGEVKERKRNVGSGQKQKGRGDRWNAFAILGEACTNLSGTLNHPNVPRGFASRGKQRKEYGV